MSNEHIGTNIEKTCKVRTFISKKATNILRNRMVSNGKHWKLLFLFSLGLALGSAFCMKWMEADLLVNAEHFTILGLELVYPKEKMMAIFSGIDDKTRTILSYHLYFDFAFMTGIFPCIACLCMMARQRASKKLVRNILLFFACLQLLAWGLDIYENTRQINWMTTTVISETDLSIFHVAVAVKWIIALSAVLLALPFFFLKKPKSQTHFLV